MDILIVGSGATAFYVADILSTDGHDVTVIDNNLQRLDEFNRELDVAIHKGVVTNCDTYEQIIDLSPQWLIALTESDETNLIVCALLKRLVPDLKTCARIRQSFLANASKVDISQVFQVDHLIVPERLVCEDILRLSINYGLYQESFAYGKVTLRTLEIPSHWQEKQQVLQDLKLPLQDVTIGLIKRRKAEETIFAHSAFLEEQDHYEYIFPHGSDTIQTHDQVTIIGRKESVSHVDFHFDYPYLQLQSAIIVGGTYVGIQLAKSLAEHGIFVRLVESSLERCHLLAEALPKVSILHQNAMDQELWHVEASNSIDLIVACTQDEEKNLIIGLLAKEAGAKQVVSVLKSSTTKKLAEKYGINHVISPTICAGNRISALLKGSNIKTAISLYERKAEILEVAISESSPFVGKKISEISSILPKNFLFAVIQQGDEIEIARGNSLLNAGSHVIVITHPSNHYFIENYF